MYGIAWNYITVSFSFDLSRLSSLINNCSHPPHVSVGIHEEQGGQIHPMSEEHETVASIALKHEYGTNDFPLPTRSWLRNSLELEHILPAVQMVTKRMFLGYTPFRLNIIFGRELVSVVKQAFDTAGYNTWEPLSLETVRARLARGVTSISPLLDTHTLKNSITFKEVKNGTTAIS